MTTIDHIHQNETLSSPVRLAAKVRRMLARRPKLGRHNTCLKTENLHPAIQRDLEGRTKVKPAHRELQGLSPVARPMLF